MEGKAEIPKELCNAVFQFFEASDYDEDLPELELPVRVKDESKFPKYRFHYSFQTEKGTFRWSTNQEL